MAQPDFRTDSILLAGSAHIRVTSNNLVLSDPTVGSKTLYELTLGSGGGTTRVSEEFSIDATDESNGYVTLASASASDPSALFETYLNGLRVQDSDVSVNPTTQRLSFGVGAEVMEDGDTLLVIIIV